MGRARESLILTYASRDDTSLIDPSCGFSHSFEAPIKRVIVGAGHEIETHSGEVARDRRIGNKWNVVDSVVGMSLELANIKYRCLEIAVGRVGAFEKFDGLREALVATGVLGERARDDAIADGDEFEIVWNPGLQFLGERAFRVKRRRVFDAGIGGILGGGSEGEQRNEEYGPEHRRQAWEHSFLGQVRSQVR